MEQLIEAVRSHCVLWDSRLPEYRDINAREKAWSEIATGLGVEKKTVKEDWRKLRDSHRNAVTRRNTKSGQAAEKRKKWKYEDQMEFLLVTNQHRQGQSNIPPATPADEEGTLASNGEDSDEEATDINVSASEQQGSSTKLSPKYREKRSREPRREDKVLNFLKDKEKRKQSKNAPDELDLFFASITKSVRNLPRPVQLRLKREIMNSVTLAEEENTFMQTVHHTEGLTGNGQQSINTNNFRPGSNNSRHSAYSNQAYSSHSEWDRNEEIGDLLELK